MILLNAEESVPDPNDLEDIRVRYRLTLANIEIEGVPDTRGG
jgi:hypothetical protein